MANRKRATFRAEGPFTIRRPSTISGVSHDVGATVTRDDLGLSSDRRVEALFEAGWIDMAPADAAPVASEQFSAPVVAVEPGEGVAGGFGADAAPDATTAPVPAPEGDNGEAGEGVAPANSDPAPVPAKPAAYKAFGFGRYFAIDAAGEKFGDQLSKVQAQGLSARDRVPLLGQAESLEK